MPSPSFAGAVLAGGKSSRMGADKALLQTEGKTWWRRRAEVLTAAGADPVFVVRGYAQALPEGFPCIRDRYPDCGPIGGIHAALMHSPSDLTAMLAVDMPDLQPDWFLALLENCAPGQGAVFTGNHGHETTAAVYPKAALPHLEKALLRGAYSLQAMIRELSHQGLMTVQALPSCLATGARNANHPSEL